MRADVALTGNIDADGRFGRFPSDFAIKGMFLARMVQLAGPGVVDRVRPRLVRPPSLGRYVPFSDYPQVDFSRLAYAVATDRFRDVATPEAMRRLARLDIQTFTASQLGKIMLGLAGDAGSAVMKLPEMYAAVMRGGSVSATRLADGRIALRFTEFYGWLDCYPIGTIEGLAGHYSARCDMEIELESELAATYFITLR